MTAEQIDAIVSASAPLVESPLPWSDFSPEQQDVFRLLMPQPSFDSDQRFYLSLWWLPVSAEEIEGLNSLCPPGTAIVGREDGEGGLWVCADLLSDALDGRRLSALLPILETLPLTYRPPEMWPEPKEEEEE